jgi:hypothetical protein
LIEDEIVILLAGLIVVAIITATGAAILLEPFLTSLWLVVGAVLTATSAAAVSGYIFGGIRGMGSCAVVALAVALTLACILLPGIGFVRE